MKKLISLALAAVMCIGMGTTALAADINVSVDGKAIEWTDAKPFIKDGRTLVPLRPIANALGLAVFWNGDTQKASFSDGVTTVAFELNSKEYVVYGAKLAESEVVQMDTAAISENGRTYAPAKYLAQAFGYNVGWEQETQTVKITSGDAPVVAEPEVEQGDETLFDLSYVEVEDIAGSTWGLTGGFLDGMEMGQADYEEVMAMYGGVLNLEFDEDKAYMVQGGGTLEGTYTDTGDSVYDVRFDYNGKELIYACAFTETADGQLIMIAMTDATGLNGLYFAQ
ncbi:MAG: copper amine oxidase N-terminal domain-containing protein [Bacillota bacterium]|nr:copper amine oxidase N-terminal domain-containing protein [Bacillota bacterium]